MFLLPAGNSVSSLVRQKIRTESPADPQAEASVWCVLLFSDDSDSASGLRCWLTQILESAPMANVHGCLGSWLTGGCLHAVQVLFSANQDVVLLGNG